MFSRRLPAVVSISPRYLAQDDGSSFATGRGSGTAVRTKDDVTTPYMQMTYAPLERRLDTAMHRALFASSVRQARQMCIHGAVKVNGKKVWVISLLPQFPTPDRLTHVHRWCFPVTNSTQAIFSKSTLSGS